MFQAAKIQAVKIQSAKIQSAKIQLVKIQSVKIQLANCEPQLSQQTVLNAIRWNACPLGDIFLE